MLKFKSTPTGQLETNCYLLYDDESKEGALFDVAGPIPSLVKEVENEKIDIKYLFFTHGHFDHVMGLEEARSLFPEAKVGINKEELKVMENMSQFAKMFGFEPSQFGQIDVYLEDKQTYKLGNIEITTIHAPGHTPGSICFYSPSFIVVGDVLFNRGIGRTDLYGGSMKQLENSIKNLFALPDETTVLPGHGPLTTIGEEKRSNPFFTSSYT